MTVRIARPGSPWAAGEGMRFATVRRLPRGVPKGQFAVQDWYDVWYPNLAPGAELIKLGQAAFADREWQAFTKKCRAEMATPESSRILQLQAVLSQQADFSVGCYCEDESRCHCAILRELLVVHAAKLG